MTWFLKPSSAQVFVMDGVTFPGLGEQLHAGRVFGHAGGGDDDGQEEAEGAGDDAAFAADDLFRGICPLALSLGSSGQRDTLAVCEFPR